VDSFPTSCGVGACASTGTARRASTAARPGRPRRDLRQRRQQLRRHGGRIHDVCGGRRMRAQRDVHGRLDSCAPGSPHSEICDNVDNNCDGTVTDSRRAAGSSGALARGRASPASMLRSGRAGRETCNLQDDDCDGSTDEGVQTPSTATGRDGFGRPRVTTLACAAPPASREQHRLRRRYSAVLATPGKRWSDGVHTQRSRHHDAVWSAPAAGGTAHPCATTPCVRRCQRTFTTPALHRLVRNRHHHPGPADAGGGDRLLLPRPSGQRMSERTGILGHHSKRRSRPRPVMPGELRVQWHGHDCAVSSPPSPRSHAEDRHGERPRRGTFTAATLRIVKSGGGTDFDHDPGQHGDVVGRSDWTPGQGDGYVHRRRPRLSNVAGCNGPRP
jgi:hypothetical protein